MEVLLCLAKRTDMHVHGAIEDRLPAQLQASIKQIALDHQGKRSLPQREVGRRIQKHQDIKHEIAKYFADVNLDEQVCFCKSNQMRCILFSSAQNVELSFHAAGASCKDHSNMGVRLQACFWHKWVPNVANMRIIRVYCPPPR